MIGNLNKYITIQISTRVSDSMGGFNLTWSDHDSVWAALWPVSANEAQQAGQVSMTISHRIRIRYRNAFKASWRIKYGNRYFNIVSVINPGERNEWLDLMCKEVLA